MLFRKLKTNFGGPLLGLLFCFLRQSCPADGQQPANGPYFGTPLGRLNTMFHEVTGDMYAVDENTLYIKNFNYDGTGPDAYFWAGNSTRPDTQGLIIPDEKGSTKPLGAYKNKDVVLRLPEGKTLRDIKWISVWCRKFSANFGDIIIPRTLIIPTPIEISPLSQLEHGVRSGPVTIVDAQTFLITDFHYDGEGPAGYWWATPGVRQTPKGLRLKDENGSPSPLRRYSGETVVIALPDDKTIWDIDWLGVWCEEFNVDFGSTRIPQNVRVPPSPKMLGIRPESKLNCEVFHDDLGFELRWVMDGDDIVMQLVGRVDAGEYMAFGLGKEDSKSDMIGADAVVTWVNHKTGQGHAVDYYLGSKEQCVGDRGSCPDIKHSGATDSITMLHATLVNGFSMVTFKRPQLGVDERFDQHIYSDGQQSVIWAIGPLNDKTEVSYHRLRTTGDMFIDFARTPRWNCPSPDGSSKPGSGQGFVTPATTSRTTNKPAEVKPKATSSNKNGVWEIPPIICPSDRTFRAQIGPTGGKKGYQAITGKVGWGIAWYINGLLIPELVVERGKTYTFIVEGGNDPVHSSRRHPFYITDNPEGGYDYRSDEEKKQMKVYAGVGLRNDGKVVPTSEGHLCEWKIDTRQKEKPEDFPDYFSFQRTLKLECQPGKAAIMHWTPDKNTPDLVYYHCYTHRLLGWKIRVVDSCDHLASASMIRHHITITNGTVTESKSSQSLASITEKQKKKNNTKPGTSRPQAPKQQPKQQDKLRNHSSASSSSSQTKADTRVTNSNPNPNHNQNSNRNTHQHESMRFQKKPHQPRLQAVPQISAVVYRSPAPSAGYNMPSGPVMSFEPYYIPTYPMPTVPSNPPNRPPVYIRQRLPPPVPPKDTGLGNRLHGGFVPMLINSKMGLVANSSIKKESKPAPSTVAKKRVTNNAMRYNVSRYGHLTNDPPTRVHLPNGYTLGTYSAKPFISQYYNAPQFTLRDEDHMLAIERDSRPSQSMRHPIRLSPPAQVIAVKPTVKRPKHTTTRKPIKVIDIPFIFNKSKPTSSQQKGSSTAFSVASNEPQYQVIAAITESNSSPTKSSNSPEVVDESPLKHQASVRPDIMIRNFSNHLSATGTVGNNRSAIANGTDHAILSHVMSLIAGGATPPDVKVYTKPTGIAYTTHVEIHHKVIKRSAEAHHDGTHHGDHQGDHPEDHKGNKQEPNSSLTLTISYALHVFPFLLLFVTTFLQPFIH